MNLALAQAWFGGHSLGYVRLVADYAVTRGATVTNIVSRGALASPEYSQFLAGANIKTLEIDGDDESGSFWTECLQVLERIQPDTLAMLLSDRLLHPSRRRALIAIRNRVDDIRCLVLKAAPGQQDKMSGDRRAEQLGRWRDAHDCLNTGLIDRLAFLRGIGDESLDAKVLGKDWRWIEDPPLLQFQASIEWQPYVVIAGDLAPRKRIQEIASVWEEVYLSTGLTLKLAGKVRPGYHVRSSQHVELYDRFLSEASLLSILSNAYALIASFSSEQFVPSSLVSSAHIAGLPIVTHGNTYVDSLVKEHGGGVHAASLRSADLVSALVDAKQLRLLPGRISTQAAQRARHQFGKYFGQPLQQSSPTSSDTVRRSREVGGK